MNADGSNVTRLTFNPSFYCVSPTWSPNLTRIAYEHNGEIYVMNSDGSRQTNLTNTSNPPADKWPSWSPDGTKIAFVSWRTDAHGIYVMDTDGSNETRLTSYGSDRHPSWSPDGSKIAFKSSSDEGAEIYR